VVEIKANDLFEHLAARGAVIERLASDSRRCAPGVAFFAYPGEAADGRAHIGDALQRGATAVLWEQSGFSWRAEWRVPNAPVRGLKEQAGRLAHEFYGRPSDSLWICGVTGTNGKTSCTQWLAALLAAAGMKSGVVGTLGSGFPGALTDMGNTTPDALELHRLLKDFARGGARAAAMEVSSHGLAQGRLNGVRFSCALFTNLSHDHLDYHRSMEAYAEAKSRLFDMPGLKVAVLNLDDVLGVQLARRLGARGMHTIGYSLDAAAVPPGSVREFIAARAVEHDAEGMRVALESSWGTLETRINQTGRFNVANALGVLGCLVSAGLPFNQVAALLDSLPTVPGRMQRLGGANAPLVVVDYAHTPDALEKVLQALRPVAHARGGRLAVVFGAGGNRDAAKRPLMGAVAARLADRVLLTSDNPRHEPALAIIGAIQEGAGGRAHVEPDRAAAIERAVSQAAARDVVLVAGKGHEGYQDLAGERLAFSDAALARGALARWSGT
jgi:UDP-N-acetylmuramoyl-L-alanyl-D-glutamate--2,6-diaminopimelate ligase